MLYQNLYRIILKNIEVIFIILNKKEEKYIDEMIKEKERNITDSETKIRTEENKSNKNKKELKILKNIKSISITEAAYSENW